MGNFKIEIEAVGGHGSDRTALQGAPHTPTDGPDKLAQDFTRELEKTSNVVFATLTHWPESTPIVDNLKTGIRDVRDFTAKWEDEPILRFFPMVYGDKGPDPVARMYCHFAYHLVATMPRSAERTLALRDLLASYDNAKRAVAR